MADYPYPPIYGNKTSNSTGRQTPQKPMTYIRPNAAPVQGSTLINYGGPPGNPFTSGPGPAAKGLLGNTGDTGWGYNEGNPFGNNYQRAQPGMGMSSTDLTSGTQNYRRAPMPEMGSSSETVTFQDVATPSPFGQRTINTKTGDAFMGGGLVGNVNGNLGNTDILTTPGGMTPPGPGPMDGAGFNPQDYFNGPGYQFQLDQGIRAMEGSASGRGLLNSTSLRNQTQEFAQGLAATYYNDAHNRYDADRKYTANRHDTAFNQYMAKLGFDWDKYKYTDSQGIDNYWKSQDAWNALMKTDYDQAKDFAKLGPELAKVSAAAAIALGVSEAEIASLIAEVMADSNMGATEARRKLGQTILAGIMKAGTSGSGGAG